MRAMSIAIGDIHGCLTTLQRLVSQLPEQEELVFLGDYIDRGPSSAGVIGFLSSLGRERPCRFLKGNHEDLMMRAIRYKSEVPNWLINGGQATLNSYGVDLDQWMDCEDRGEFLGKDISFFNPLPTYFENNETIFVHAGIDPLLPGMSGQDEQLLMWVRERFYRNADRWQGKRVVFGHTPTRSLGLEGHSVFRSHRVVGIDTGCVYGDCLTALNASTGEIYQEKSDFTY